MQDRAPQRYNILLIRSSSIGDVILATACLQYLEKAGISASVFWLGREPALDLIRRSYPETTCLPINTSMNANLNMVRNLPNIDLVVDLQVNLRSVFISLCISALKGSRVIWCRKRGIARSLLILRARFWPRNVPRKRRDTVHQYRLMLSCLKRGLDRAGLGHPGAEAYPRLLPEKDVLPLEVVGRLKEGKWLAVAPGAAHPAKQAPEDVFQTILRQLKTKAGADYGLVFLGEKKDYAIADSICAKLRPGERVLNLCGTLNLWQSINVLPFCKSILGNDTSLCHAAQAFDVPSAVLFGPTVEEFGFDAWGGQSQSFSSPLGCRPCSKHGKIPCRFKDYLCFSGIEKQAVADFLSSHLG